MTDFEFNEMGEVNTSPTGLPNTYSYLPHYSLFTITNAFTLGGNSRAQFDTNTYQVNDDVTMAPMFPVDRSRRSYRHVVPSTGSPSSSR